MSDTKPAPLLPLSREEREEWLRVLSPWKETLCWTSGVIQHDFYRALTELDRLESERAQIAENARRFLGNRKEP